jgi:hypothetical protein
MTGAARARMTTETTAWLVARVAGIASGVITGAQHRVTTSAIVAISAVIAVRGNPAETRRARPGQRDRRDLRRHRGRGRPPVADLAAQRRSGAVSRWIAPA